MVIVHRTSEEYLALIRSCAMHECTGEEFVGFLRTLHQERKELAHYELSNEDVVEIHVRYIDSLSDDALRRHAHQLLIATGEGKKNPLFWYMWLLNPDYCERQ